MDYVIWLTKTAFIMITLHEPSINQLPSTESTDTAGESATGAKSLKPKSELKALS